jgi:hypothetical protein
MKLYQQAGALICAGIMIASTAAKAEGEHRELGPHVHGHGTLAIAFEADKVQMEFTAPGMDIVGFEHSAETDDQTKAVEKALADLNEPLKYFSFPAAAGCQVSATDVNIVAEAHEEHADETNAEGKAGTEDHEDHEGHHNEFRAVYSLTCTDPAKISRIDFPFFDRFAGSQELDVTIIDDSGQKVVEVSRDTPRLDR